MKDTIFIFIYGYLPGFKYGGPVTSIFNFSEHFGEKYDIRIVCSNHDHGSDIVYPHIKSGWNIVGKASVMYLPEKEYNTLKFYKLMKPYNIKMVYLTGVFSYTLNHAAIKAANKLKAPIVIATRGEILKNILEMKKYKKIPYLWIMKICKEFNNIHFQITSDEERIQLIKYLNISENYITMLPNIHGKTMSIFPIEKKSGSAKMLFVSRIHPKKNLLDALKAIIDIKGILEFDIYGPIEDKKYWNECKKIISIMPNNIQVRYCGTLNINEAKKCYYNYHACLFPTLSENYGHVIVESIIANCPVIISKGTTPWDDIHEKAGYITELHNIPELRQTINKIIDMDNEELKNLRYSLEIYREKKLKLHELLTSYEKLIEKCNQ